MCPADTTSRGARGALCSRLGAEIETGAEIEIRAEIEAELLSCSADLPLPKLDLLTSRLRQGYVKVTSRSRQGHIKVTSRLLRQRPSQAQMVDSSQVRRAS